MSIVKDGVDLCFTEEEKSKLKESEKEFEVMAKAMRTVLDKYIDKVIVTGRLLTSPCVIVANEHAMSGNMERISRAQTLRSHPTKDIWGSKRQFEINPDHSVIRRLKTLYEADANDPCARDLTWILFETALLQSGFALDDPSVHTERIYRLISMGLGIDMDGDGIDVQDEKAKVLSDVEALTVGMKELSVGQEQVEEEAGELFEVD